MLITGANAEWWAHVPTLGTVTVRDARSNCRTCGARARHAAGRTSVKLESYRDEAPFNVPAATIEAAERAEFAVPATSSC